jgi:hypothetical protein
VLESGVGGDCLNVAVKILKGYIVSRLKVEEITVDQVGFIFGCEALAALDLPEPAEDYGAECA